VKPSKELCEALSKLKPYPAFQLFLQAIDQAGIDAMLELVDAPPDRVGRLQGRAALSRDLLDVANSAEKTLAKYQRSDNQPGEDGNARSTRISPQASGAF